MRRLELPESASGAHPYSPTGLTVEPRALLGLTLELVAWVI